MHIKNLIFILIGICVICLTSCSKTSTMKSEQIKCEQPGSYFPEGEQRYILVDESTQYLGGTEVECFIYADKYMGTMYLYTVRHYWGKNIMSKAESSTWDMILYEDGSPMIYDGGNQ